MNKNKLYIIPLIAGVMSLTAAFDSTNFCWTTFS